MRRWDVATASSASVWLTALNTAAARHFGAAMKTAHYIEYLHQEFWQGELTQNLTLNEPPIIDGMIAVSDALGLGIELNMDYLNKISQ